MRLSSLIVTLALVSCSSPSEPPPAPPPQPIDLTGAWAGLMTSEAGSATGIAVELYVAHSRPSLDDPSAFNGQLAYRHPAMGRLVHLIEGTLTPPGTITFHVTCTMFDDVCRQEIIGADFGGSVLPEGREMSGTVSWEFNVPPRPVSLSFNWKLTWMRSRI